MTLLVDIFEPDYILNLLTQSISVNKVELNHYSFADYMWTDCENHTNHVERKSIDEILSNVLHVEEQLSREVLKADRTYLLYEGTFAPLPAKGRPQCRSYHATKDNKLMVPGHVYNESYSGVMAWLDQLDRHGITVIHSMSQTTTASILIALYNNSQKPIEMHSTFNRIYKQRVFPKPKTSQDEMIATLMGIEGVELGEYRATKLIMEFGDVITVLNRSVSELAECPGIGKTIATRLLKAIGRTDIK
jgi:ERCC4-type nuclease